MDTVNKYVLLMHIFHLLSSNQMKTKTDAALTSCFRFDSLVVFTFVIQEEVLCLPTGFDFSERGTYN